MFKKLYSLAIALAIALPSFAQTGSGSLKGVIKDEKTGETIPFAAVVVKQGDAQIAGTATDINGQYTIKPLAPGRYDLYVQVVGYNSKLIKGVLINSDKISFQDVSLVSGIELDEFEVVDYVVPLIDRDGGASGGTVTAEDIAKMPLRDAASIATTVAGVTSDADGDLNVRGARSENTYYYIDGVKVIGSSTVPKSAMQEVSVITGGVPANYGDVTGGIVNITTKGASSQLYGGIEFISSGFQSGENGVGLDHFGYNLVEGLLSGPIAFKKDSLGNRERSIFGFFVSANYISELDERPTFGLVKINDDVREQIIADPLRISADGSNAQYNAEFLTSDAFHDVHTTQNDLQQQVNVAGKFDIAPSEQFDIAVGLQYNWEKDNVGSTNRLRGMMNSEFNARTTNQDIRAYVRFVQRFKNNPNGKGVKNAFYSILVDYTKSGGIWEDKELTDNYFGYGNLGKFTTHSQPFYLFDADRQAFIHQGFEDTLVTFDASQLNSEAAAITNQYYDFFGDNENGNISSLTAIQAGNGLINGEMPAAPYALWTHPGARSNFYRKFDNQQFRISANGSADIGDHALQIGVEFEQRVESRWAIGDYVGRGPINLWLLARQQTNSHLAELDRTDSTVSFPQGTWAYVTYDRLVDLNSQSTFDRNLRSSLGLDPDGDVIIDVDALDPNQLNLEFFSPDELLNQGNNYVEYRGYDPAGNKTSGSSNFNDFFTATDENGNFTREIGAYSPNYVAGYIMDKFAFKDIIFNVGIRVDRFDANQGVLIDPFVIGETYKAGEVSSIGGEPVSHPSTIGSDYVVYVDNVDDPTRIVGYRDDEQWFDAQGSPIQDPGLLTINGSTNPYMVFGSDDLKNVSTAFEDYKPQVNVMPRIAFSFPISDVALFFAHYDVLTQRPTGSNILNPIDYLYIRTISGSRNLDEPNLKSEKTTDYELGFQQVLSKTSSIKMSIYYRQLQDNIQLRSYVGAYPVQYSTFDNIDFGTVKGFSLTYDLRRTGNVRLNLAYNLQFAEGTGSSATTAQALINAGQPNLRTVYPLNFDSRHNLALTFDWRYGRGANYNGPGNGTSQPLADFGINFIARFNSGTPYSASKRAASIFEGNGGNQLTGQINGSRLPAQFRLDLQIDKSWPIKLGSDDNGNRKMGNLNINLWITNLLGTKNINAVYRYTGNPEDDGYLATTRGQQDMENRLSPESFENYYTTRVQNPYNFGMPRTIRLGLRFDF